MAKCKLCHEDNLVDSHGYCGPCKRLIAKEIKLSRAALSDLAKASGEDMTDARRQEMLLRAKDACTVLKKYSKTPYYKGDLERECRRSLFLLGGTSQEYREIVGYGYIVKRIVLSIVIVILIFVIGFWLYISGY